MPTERLHEEGFEPIIGFCNPNIAPKREYERRLDTIKTWSDRAGLKFIELPIDPREWDCRVARPFEERRLAQDPSARLKRCESCYRLRFEAIAQASAEYSIPWISSTLSVSPYQYGELINQELQKAAFHWGIQSHFEDFRPYYPEATRRAKALGLYRQNYCGCAYSAAEAQAERVIRREQRRKEREAKALETQKTQQQQERQRQQHQKERLAYDQKRARQKALLRSLRGLG